MSPKAVQHRCAQQPRLCPHCHAHASQQQYSFSGRDSICCAVTASECAGVLPERMFSPLFGETAIFQMILALLSIRKPHGGVLQRERAPGKCFASLYLKSGSSSPTQFWLIPNLLFLCFEWRLTETLCIYTVQMLSFAVETYGGNSFIHCFISHYCQTPYLSLPKRRGD